jgi:hypothetical protein
VTLVHLFDAPAIVVQFGAITLNTSPISSRRVMPASWADTQADFSSAPQSQEPIIGGHLYDATACWLKQPPSGTDHSVVGWARNEP